MSPVPKPKTRHSKGSPDQSDPPGTDTRRAALSLLDAVLRKGLPLEAAHSATAGLARADDRAFATAIASEVLRWLPDLDALIDSATAKRMPDDAKARAVLRIALAQALRMSTAPHAAISTALPLVASGPRRLVHGVFGALMRGEAKLPDAPSLPTPVAERWKAAWGWPVVVAGARSIAAPPPIDLVSPSGAFPDGIDGVSLHPGHLRVPAGTSVTELPGFYDGGWWVQDVSAALPATLLGQGEGRSVLDLCAAPGGKTMQLAAAGWTVTAVDMSEARLERLKENLERNHLSATIVQADVMAWAPSEPVDAILLDAPCSSTGIFRRHPDVLHRVRPSGIAEMAALQQQLLARAADWLKPGGTLVYSVCSLEPAEGEGVIAAFLEARPDFAMSPAQAPDYARETAKGLPGTVRILPGTLEDAGGADGFFIARLIRG